jgi:hypothetical protein
MPDPLDQQLVEAVLARPGRRKADMEEVRLANIRPSRAKASSEDGDGDGANGAPISAATLTKASNAKGRTKASGAGGTLAPVRNGKLAPARDGGPTTLPMDGEADEDEDDDDLELGAEPGTDGSAAPDAGDVGVEVVGEDGVAVDTTMPADAPAKLDPKEVDEPTAEELDAISAERIAYAVDRCLLRLERIRLDERADWVGAELLAAESRGERDTVTRLIDLQRQTNESRRAIDRQIEQATVLVRA